MGDRVYIYCHGIIETVVSGCSVPGDWRVLFADMLSVEICYVRRGE